LRLRTYLPLLTLAIYLPILVAIGGILVLSAREQQAATQQQMFLTARAVAAAADREMEDSIDSLRAIASSSEVLDGDIGRIYALAQRVVAAQPHWRTLALLDAKGGAIFFSDRPLGATLPSVVDRDHIKKVIETGAPAVSPVLLTGRFSGTPVIGVAAPVYVAGEFRYIVVANYAFEGLRQILQAVELPRGSTAAILDHDGRIISRNIEPSFVGQPVATPAMAQAAQLGIERATRAVNKEGRQTFAVLAPSKMTQWAVLIGMSIDAYDAPLWHTIWTIGGGGVLLILIGAVVAGLGGRRIADGVGALAAAAEALGRGETKDAEPARFLEIRTAAAAITRAGELIQRRRSERDDALRRLQTRVRCQEALALIGQLGLQGDDVDRLLRSATDAVAIALQVEFCAIMELEPEPRTLLVRAARGWRGAVIGSMRIEADPGSQAGYTLITGAPAVIVNADTENRFDLPKPMHEQGALSGITVLMQKQGGPFGILAVHERTPRTFTVDDVQFCEAAATLLSTILIRWENELAVRRLADENAQFAAAINGTNRGVMFVDARPGHPILFVNPAFTRITGYTAADAVGRDPASFLRGADTDPRDAAAIDGALAARRTATVTIRNYRKDGQYFWNELTIIPVPSPEDTRMFVEVICDVTARRNAEEQLRQSQKLDALGQLTGGVAHDFNNLLAVILGNADTLETELAGNVELSRMASLICHAAEQGRALTGRLLSFARAQPMQPETVDVNALTAEMAEMLRGTLGENIVVRTELGPSAPMITVDRPQLQAAIVNLAINSRDAMPKGGTLTIRTATSAPNPAEANAGTQVVISVADTGIGMPPEILARACEPFFTTKEPGRGTGLGLSSVYGFVHQSAGEMDIRSAPGEGAIITLRFPQTIGAIEPPLPLPTDRPAVTSDGRTILVVDDDESVAASVEVALSGIGYRVARATSPMIALRILAEKEFDLLLTDLAMPGMDGIELAAAARRLRPGLKVLFTSGHLTYRHRAAMEPGVEILWKPYRRAQLADAIRRAFATAGRGLVTSDS